MTFASSIFVAGLRRAQPSKSHSHKKISLGRLERLGRQTHTDIKCFLPAQACPVQFFAEDEPASFNFEEQRSLPRETFIYDFSLSQRAPAGA